MAGRASVFADAEIIRLARERFVAVAADDWYQRRRDDAEGKFFRKVADQGPRKGRGGGTRQGIYCFTADGKLLTYRNHHDPAVMRRELHKALREWDKLPEDRRKPGAVKVGDEGKPDRRYHREPPEGGLVVNVFTRVLDEKDGEFCKGTSARPGGAFAARDHLWLTAQECQALAPADAKKGDSFAAPARVRERILRFHLVDNTRGEPPHWRPEDVRQQKMTLTVEEVTGAKVRLRLEGSAVLATRADVKESDRGFDVSLLGHVEYDRGKKAVTRFDVVAVGEHWGQGRYTGGARPGRSPLGVAFELAAADDPSRTVPPQAARDIQGYLGK